MHIDKITIQPLGDIPVVKPSLAAALDMVFYVGRKADARADRQVMRGVYRLMLSTCKTTRL